LGTYYNYYRITGIDAPNALSLRQNTDTYQL